MPDLKDGESIEMRGSAAKPYIIKNVGGVYSCSCPAWRNQSLPIERRTCKHIRKLRGDEAEEARIGGALPARPAKAEGEEEKEGPPVLLAETWQNDVDLTGWWMSEKLDGVRAYWDGKQFISRQGNLYHAPDWFLEGLPDVPLDGELWLDRKKFQRAVSIVRRQDKPDLWKEISYLIYDAPALSEPFETRLEYVAELLLKGTPRFARALEQQRCNSVEHLREELARVEALGGEGLMLRQPGSMYESKRSSTLLKVKTFRDAEARVIGHEPGKGRHKGRLGALFVELPGGIQFKVGTGFSDAERESPPPIGTTITFRYQELTEAGVPRFPAYLGVRDDVVVAAPEPVATPEEETRERIIVSTTPPEPAGGSEVATRRRYFEFSEGTSNKFWEITWTDGAKEFSTRWGKIGTQGRITVKKFKDAAKCKAAVQKIIEEKIDGGYEEMDVPS
jgi:DNA ligase-1